MNDMKIRRKFQPIDGGGSCLENSLLERACGFDPRSFRRVFMGKSQPIDGGGTSLLARLRFTARTGSSPVSSAHASVAEGISNGLLLRGPWFDSKWGHSGVEERLPSQRGWVHVVERQMATRFGLTHRISSWG